MTIVDDTIAAGVAALSRVTTQPVIPFGFGRDLRCTHELDPRLAEVSGDDPTAITEALIRRWTCPRGALLDDPDYGIDLNSYLNRGVPLLELYSLEGILKGEGLKDDRIADLSVTVKWDVKTATLNVSAVVTPEDPDLSEFAFTFAIVDGTTTLEALRK